MTDTEKAVTWGLLGLIAWELWKPAAQPVQSSGMGTIGDGIPLWVKQLSRHRNDVDYFRMNRGIWKGC